jgi:4-amino-4-deoxy-L-arabinose transferase-like glycosyltransferase
VSSRPAKYLIIFLAFLALLLALHLAYLNLPFHWDELGQFVPAALDLYREGAWVSHSSVPNVHPPGVMALLAAVWSVTGYSIPAARVTMLAMASLGLLLSFLLAIRLGRGAAGAPAFPAVLFLLAAPIFYTQSMMVLLDMPAMVLTVLSLLLFLKERYAACAVASTLLVLVKETAITTPVVFAAWLWFQEKRRVQACYFLAPAAALAGWLAVLHGVTGYWTGNAEFARYNVAGSLEPLHLLAAIVRRAWFLFVSDGHWMGTLALAIGWRLLRGRDWKVAGYVAGAQTLIVTLLGGAILERYLLPVLPILYAAMAAAASAYPAAWRRASHTIMIALLWTGWFWNPPYPFPAENNLTMIDYVRLQKDAANYLEAYASGRRIASVWPLTDALRRPEFGYVRRPMRVVQAPGSSAAELARINRNDFDLLAVYGQTPNWLLELDLVQRLLRRYYDYRPPATDEEIRSGLGLVPLMRVERGDLWIQIYSPQGGDSGGIALAGPAR